MMIGVELTCEGAPIVKACLDRRLLINCTHGIVLRLLPALNITEEQFTKAAIFSQKRCEKREAFSC